MTAAADKSTVRAMVLAQRAGISDGIREELARRLAKVGPGLALGAAKPPGTVVSAFLPIRREVDTVPLIESLNREGFATALPVVEARRSPLLFRLWSPGEPLEIGSLNIQEPLRGVPEVDPDVLFIPLAGFDRTGNRLGYGAGYYDHALAGLRRRKTVLAIGVAFGVQEVQAIPVESHDEPLDIVITESQTIFCRRS